MTLLPLSSRTTVVAILRGDGGKTVVENQCHLNIIAVKAKRWHVSRSEAVSGF